MFDRNNRGLGYGTRAFNICAQGMQRHSVVKEIIVKIKADDHGALSFWRKLGFERLYGLNNKIVMSLNLKNAEAIQCRKTTTLQ
ncbi:MAG: GNAT family N-acetyltransferase [Thermodesulfovibrionales bacterium]